MDVPSLRLFKEKINEVNNKLTSEFNKLGSASKKNYTSTVKEGGTDLVTADAVYQAIINYKGLKGTIEIRAKDRLGEGVTFRSGPKVNADLISSFRESKYTDAIGDVSITYPPNPGLDYSTSVSSIASKSSSWVTNTGAFRLKMQGSGKIRMKAVISNRGFDGSYNHIPVQYDTNKGIVWTDVTITIKNGFIYDIDFGDFYTNSTDNRVWIYGVSSGSIGVE